jgi:hypothetical protein
VSTQTVRRFVEGLLRGQATEHARPDDFEAEQMKTAIELRAARLGSDAPREGFVTDLHRRLASEMAEGQTPATHPRWAPARNPAPGRHRHIGRGRLGGGRGGGGAQPARTDRDAASDATHPG